MVTVAVMKDRGEAQGIRSVWVGIMCVVVMDSTAAGLHAITREPEIPAPAVAPATL